MARNSSSAVDLTLLNTYQSPARRPEVAPVRRPEIVKNPPKSKAAMKRESRLALFNAVKIIGIATIVLALFAGIISSRIKLAMLESKTQEYLETLEVVESENVRLNMQLDAMVSEETVKEYAENVLGLRKVEKYQIHYFESNSADSAVVLGEVK